MMGAVLITGGARRLGAAMARAVAASGFRVVIHARHAAAEAEALAAELAGHIVLGELAEDPARIVDDAIAKAGPLFGLINNASHFVFDDAHSVTAQSIAAHYIPNLTAPVLLAQRFAARRTLETGVIINILDQKLTNLNPDFFAYTLSKAALAAASEMLAMALAPAIRVAAIAPGIALPGPNQSEENFQKSWRANPLHRGALPEDIAAAAVFLLKTPSVTGITIPVDGGEHLTHRGRDVAFLSP